MNSMQKRLIGFFKAPVSRLIWPALALFLLGNALCPFNPPSGDRAQVSQGRETMNTPVENQPQNDKTQFMGIASPTSEFQTATFALG